MDKELLLYNYFSNQLTAEQERAFNDLLDTDADFKAQFLFEKDLQQAIRKKENQELKTKMQGFEREIVKKAEESSPKKRFRYLAVAASVTVLIALALMQYMNSSTAQYDDLYAANFHEYPNTVFPITRGETDASVERDAFVAYEQGDYHMALENFDKIASENRKPYVDFYKGLSYLSLDQNQDAKASFKRTIDSNTNFGAEARWYWALLAIKEKDKSKALELLNELVSDFEYNKEKAMALIQELE
ncbi:MAG: hypothetical protein Mars2KO_45350 [Maribacter sp.]